MSEADGKNGSFSISGGEPIYGDVAPTPGYGEYESPTGIVGYTPEIKTWVPTQGSTEDDGTYNDVTLDGSKNQASNATAALVNSRFDVWKETFFPKIEELMAMTTYMNPGLVGTETAKAAELTGQAFNNVEAGQNRNLARYGLQQTAEQQTAQTDALALGRSAATVNAENSTRLALKDRDRAIATGGLGTIGGPKQ